MRNSVIFVNAPNSDDYFLNSCECNNAVAKGVQHTDWANFPHLGILSLASYINMNGFNAVYFDGVAISPKYLFDHVNRNADDILAVCFSSITANFEASIDIGKKTKAIDNNIKIIFGNDHFSVMYKKIMRRYNCIDYGIIGNEVYQTLLNLLKNICSGNNVDCRLPSLVSASILTPEKGMMEEINYHIDYSLIDKHFNHTAIYNKNFQSRLTGRIHDLTQRFVSSGVPVEIARGCIKFSGDDACSFCSIQYGSMWRNTLTHEKAWGAIRNAHQNGYDYLYITADELPLTFARLMLNMNKFKPKWWLDLPESQRPMLVGYARADGMEKESVMRAMANIGFKILFVGIDAGAMKSLQALRKPLRSKDVIASSNTMYTSNFNAINNARKYNLKIKAGFVLGHLGMDKNLLCENINSYKKILNMGRDVIISADIELLSPEPGSKDFEYLINPNLAKMESHRLGLTISNDKKLTEISSRYRDRDIFDREEAINDYIDAMMPSLIKEDISRMRDKIRTYSHRLGIVVGDEI